MRGLQITEIVFKVFQPYFRFLNLIFEMRFLHPKLCCYFPTFGNQGYEIPESLFCYPLLTLRLLCKESLISSSDIAQPAPMAKLLTTFLMPHAIRSFDGNVEYTINSCSSI
ncbi:hypothetical protein C7212DRAFT_317608 [Tuber magnatum]|uniref:Uncharacterized protein n=1 Tax=Tuber magnatum TaxID=42249 RepID=A0A317SSD1_9PEZI|nr:hypothetical protein C7212DRAFT_317608 [Tuber magnatum]